jgi:hypothetical protein
MTSFIGNRFCQALKGLIPPRKVICGGYRTIIGNGSDLFTGVIAHFASAEYTNASPRHLDWDPQEVAGLLEFAGGVPATKLISGRDFVQIETAAENLTPYSEDMTNQWTAENASWGDQDFLGGVMTKLVEASDTGKEHSGFTGAVVSVVDTQTYYTSIYVKADERTEIRMAWESGFPVGTWCEFDVENGTKGSSGVGVGANNYGIYLVKEGIYRCWFKATCNSTGNASWRVSLLNALGNLVYNGDGSSGLYLWGGQVEDGTPENVSSYIETSGSSVIRAKDQMYWASANVPDAFRGDFEFDWIPYIDDSTGDFHYFYDFKASGGSHRIIIYYYYTTNIFRVYDITGGTELVASDPVTYNSRSIIHITVYPSDGLLEIEGCDSGDGTYVGIPWETTAGDIWTGQSQASNNQCNGLISEPHKPRYLRDPLVLANFDDADFTNASARDLDYPLRGYPSIESFASGVLAEATIGGNRFAQIELARTNSFTYNRQIGHINWSKTGVEVDENAIEAPDGTLTADKVSETAITDFHLFSQTKTPDGVSYYVFSVYAKAEELSDFVLTLDSAGFPASAYGYFDLSAGTCVPGAGVVVCDLENCGNGWYRCYIAALSNAAVATPHYILLDSGISYPGTADKGMYFWNPQVEYGGRPSSPIFCEATPVTRAKDQLHWASANVPALLRGRFKFQWIPYDDYNNGDDRYMFDFKDSGASIRVLMWYLQSTNKIRLRIDGVNYDSSALTFDRHQKLIIGLDPTVGEFTLEGFTSGNGTTTAVPYTTSEGDVSWGMSDSKIVQCKGLISEPYL